MEDVRITSALMASLISLSACSGSGNSDSDDDTAGTKTSPIGGTTPASDAVDVSRDAAIQVTFKQDVYNQSVDSSSLTLASEAPVSGQTSFDATNNRISFTPDEKLRMLTDYTATATTGITDLSGEPLLESPYTWPFQTADGTWRSSLDIDDSSGGASGAPSLAVNDEGRALVAWHQRDGAGDYSIYRSLYTPEQGQWSTAALLETNGGNAQLTDVAINNDGDVVVVWMQYGTSEYDLWANYYDSEADSWSGAQVLESDPLSAVSPAVAIDSNGRAAVVWKQSGLQSNLYEPGTGWGSVEEVSSTTNMNSPKITVDGQGEFSVVWTMNTAGVDDIYVSRWAESDGWQTPVNIESDDAGNATSPSLSATANGDLIAVWEQSDGSVASAWANRFDREAGTWGTATLLENDDSGDVQDVYVDQDASGNAIAVWQQFDGSQHRIWSADYNAGTGWKAAGKVETDDTAHATEPRVSMDDNGNAVVTWIKDTASFDPIMASRRVSGEAWQEAVLLDTNDESASYPSIKSAGQGEVFAVWRQSKEVLTNRLD